MHTTSKLIIGGAAIALLLAATAASADREVDGEKAYRENCASCHDRRIEGAPKTGAPAGAGFTSPLQYLVWSDLSCVYVIVDV